MGHFHHKVGVSRRGERWRGPWREIRPPLPRFSRSVVARHSSPRPGRGNGADGLVPTHTWVTQGPERVRAMPQVTQQLREARTGAAPREPCSLRARSLTSPQGQRGSAAAGTGVLSPPGVLGLDSRQKPVLGPVPAPESAGGRPGTVLGGGQEPQGTGDRAPGGGGQGPREGEGAPWWVKGVFVADTGPRGLQEGAWGGAPEDQGLTETAVAHHPHPPRDPVQGHVLESGGLVCGPSSVSCRLPAPPQHTHQAWAAADLWTFDP